MRTTRSPLSPILASSDGCFVVVGRALRADQLVARALGFDERAVASSARMSSAVVQLCMVGRLNRPAVPASLSGIQKTRPLPSGFRLYTATCSQLYHTREQA